MGYTKIKNFKVDRGNLKITGKAASSNVRDWNNCLIYEDFSSSFATLDDLENHLVGWANDLLGGMVVFPRSHAFVKRVHYLSEHDYLVSDRGWSTVGTVTDDLKGILSGRIRVKVSAYSVEGPSYGIKANRATYGLREKKKATKFLSRESAEAYLARNPKWTSDYHLKIVEHWV